MQVREVMTGNPQVISPQTTVSEAAQLMRDMDTGFLPIGEDDRLIGVVTDRDIVVRVVAEGRIPDSTPVTVAKTEKVLYCFEDDNLQDAAQSMKNQQVYRLIVLNNKQEKRLCGVVTLGDISRRAQDANLTGETAQKVSRQAA